ncbi:MAG: hypothetical protein JRN43_01915 [Nitrososphaerota archaeon]|nr:hypothetical protein [Nitrososphaerota archaeon]MDG7019051.1 hypothetical protein [Nitrososphaerota archaeon]
MDEKEVVVLRIELPKQVYDFIRNDGKKFGRTPEEEVDRSVREKVAERLIEMTREKGEDPGRLAFDLALDEYIAPVKDCFFGYAEGLHLTKRHQRTEP